MLLRREILNGLLACARLNFLSRSMNSVGGRRRVQAPQNDRDQPVPLEEALPDEDENVPNRMPKFMRVRLASACFKMREWGKAGKVLSCCISMVSACQNQLSAFNVTSIRSLWLTGTAVKIVIRECEKHVNYIHVHMFV